MQGWTARVLFGVMLVVGFSRPHAAHPEPRLLRFAGFACSVSPSPAPERQCLAAVAPPAVPRT